MAQPRFFAVKSLIITAVVAVVLLFVYRAAPDENSYAQWHTKRVAFYYNMLDTLSQDLRPAYRMKLRFGSSYLVPHYIAQQLASGDTLLLPPARFIKQYYPEAYWTDPRIFYYLTGPYPTVTIHDTARLRSATHFVWMDETLEPRVLVIPDAAMRDSIIAIFRTHDSMEVR